MASLQIEIHSDPEDLQRSELTVWRLLHAKIKELKGAIEKLRPADDEGGKMLEAIREFELLKDHPKVLELARKIEHHPSELSEEQRRTLDAAISALLPVYTIPGGDGTPARVQWRTRDETTRPRPPEEVVDSTPPDPIPQIDVPVLAAYEHQLSERPLKFGAAQDAAILEKIKSAGYDPMQLPINPPGKPGVKAAIRASLVGINANFPKGGKQFDHAWERLRANGEIADQS